MRIGVWQVVLVIIVGIILYGKVPSEMVKYWKKYKSGL